MLISSSPSLDFQAKYVSDWNLELLWAGGVLARTVYEEEMSEIGRLWGTKVEIEEAKKKELEERALHLLKCVHQFPSQFPLSCSSFIFY